MRLVHYINESSSNYTILNLSDEEIVNLIKKDCKKFLSEAKGKFFYRRITKSGLDWEQNYKVHTPTRERIPTDSSNVLHDLFNDAFQKKFGWKVRNGVHAKLYTNEKGVSLFFPIGNYRYVYSNALSDFYPILGTFYHLNSFIKKNVDKNLDKNQYQKYVEIIVNKYFTNKKLTSLKPQYEIVFDCNNYYLINIDIKDLI